MNIIPIYRRDGKVILFSPLSVINMQRAFAITAAVAKKRMESGKEDCGNHKETVELGATKEYTVAVRFTGVIDPKQKEGYLVKASVIRNSDEETIAGEHFFAPDHKINDNAMEFFNEGFGYEEGSKEQMQFFAELAEANVKFKTVIDFIFGHDLPVYFDLKNLSYDMAFGKKPKAFNYLVNYGVDPNNQFSDLDYLSVAMVKGKYVVTRKKIDLRINDSLEEHYNFTSFEKFSAFLIDLNK